MQIEKNKIQDFLNELHALSLRHGLVLQKWCAGISAEPVDENFKGYACGCEDQQDHSEFHDQPYAYASVKSFPPVSGDR